MEDPARMPLKPSQHVRVFVSGIVIDYCMDDLAGWNLCLDGVEEADELLMAVALHVLAGDCAIEDVEGRKQRGGAVPLVIVGPFFIGKPGWVRSRAWIWLFSSMDRTMACAGGAI